MNQPLDPGHVAGHLRLAVDNGPGGAGPAGPLRPEAARPVPEDYGLTAADLRLWYAPGRVGTALGLLIAAGNAAAQAIAGAARAEPWILGAVSGLFEGAFLGGLAGLGAMVLVHWADPLVARLWPPYGRLRLYREALSEARRADEGWADGHG